MPWPSTRSTKRAVAKARELIDARQYVLDSDWGEVQPRADAQNAYLESHSWEDYARVAPRVDRRRQRRNQGAICVRVRRSPAAAPNGADRMCVPRGRMAAQGCRGGRAPVCCSISTVRRGWNPPGLPTEHEVHDAFAQRHGCFVGGSRPVQKADARREQHCRPQVGFVVFESAVDKGLSNRAQHAPVASLDARLHRFIRQRPDAHRPFERPVIGRHQRLHHHGQSLTGIGVADVLEPSPAFVVQAAPSTRQGGAVLLHVGEVPVEAALGDVELLAQPTDSERVRSAVG